MNTKPPSGPPAGPPSGPDAARPSGPPRGPSTSLPRGGGETPPPVPSAANPPTVVRTATASNVATVGQPAAGSQTPRWLPAAIVIGAAAALLIGFLVFSSNDDPPTGAANTSTTPAVNSVSSSTVPSTVSGLPGEIFREPRKSIGPNPFTPSVDVSPPLATEPSGRISPQTPFPSDSFPTPAAPGEVQAISGNAPGLYGGTRDRASCDATQLVDFLDVNQDKASVWAAVQQIQPSDIRDFVATLTPVILRTDTRVTNYGFDNGQAPDRQVVLQAGTAVMVDNFGVPRVRCFCGNPLRPPIPEPVPTFTGDTWDGFDTGQVSVISESPAPVADFTLVDIDTGTPFERPTGTSGDTDGDSNVEIFPPSTTEFVDTIIRPPSPDDDVTSVGQIGATTTYGGQAGYSPDKAVDGDPSTSWFSAGPDPGESFTFFGWRAASDLRIDDVYIFGNATNEDPTVRQNFGFESVQIVIVDALNQRVFDQTVDLAGTPDPDIRVTPNVVGSLVQLFFYGAEDPTCGGITEFYVAGSSL